jgi:hypothetical protein
MDKPARSHPRALAEVLRKTLTDAFAKQGFASVELVTRWAEIVGPEIAAHSQPEKIQWPRTPQARNAPEPGTLMLRVEGPAALEVQHLSDVILQRVNQFFGWQAVGSMRLRQAPLSRRAVPRPSPRPCRRSRTRSCARPWPGSAPPWNAASEMRLGPSPAGNAPFRSEINEK